MSDIYGFLGKMGCGKTMLQTAIGIDMAEEKEKLIASNYAIKKYDYIPLDSLESIEKQRNCVMLLDELWLWLFSRMAQSKVNKALNKMVMLNRKRGVDILYTAQLSRAIDVMVREVTSYFFYPRIKPVVTAEGKKFYVRYKVYNSIGQKIGKERSLNDDTKYWGSFYDTTEEIGKLSLSFLEQGIITEQQFEKALKKNKSIFLTKLLANSGRNSGWIADVLASSTFGNNYAFDVKGSNNQYIQIECMKIAKQLENIKEHNNKSHGEVRLYYAYLDNTSEVKDRDKQKSWFIYEVTDNSYLLTLKSNQVRYDKLVKQSEKLNKNIF